MSITLYSAPLSSATPVIHALAELKVTHEVIDIDVQKGGRSVPELVALNPNAKVPTLVVDGTPMFEALAIMQWLGDRYGVESGLWPKADAPERLAAISWSTWAYVQFGGTLSRYVYSRSDAVSKELHDAPRADGAGKELQHLLGLLDARLAQAPYMLGNSFTLVDLIVGSPVTYSTVCGVAVDDHENVKAWLERLRARPAYRQAWAPAA